MYIHIYFDSGNLNHIPRQGSSFPQAIGQLKAHSFMAQETGLEQTFWFKRRMFLGRNETYIPRIVFKREEELDSIFSRI